MGRDERGPVDGLTLYGTLRPTTQMEIVPPRADDGTAYMLRLGHGLDGTIALAAERAELERLRDLITAALAERDGGT